APQARYAWKTSARSTWDIGVREQLFFAVGADPGSRFAPNGSPGGLLDQAHSALLGYTYALTPWATLTARAGGILVTGGVSDVVMPTARVGIESYTPDDMFSFTVAHDLMIGPTTAGPVVADVAELGWIRDWEHFAIHLGTGLYRNIGVDKAYVAAGALGYTANVALAWKFTRDLRLEGAALRDARLNDLTVAQQVDRDVLQLRFVWEKARF
ncbi:MAG: hypothetical protein ACM3PC_01475, partial [Deltaproteobacteria bacterium]